MRISHVPSKVLNNMVHFLAPYEQAVEELKLKLKGIKYGFQKSGRYSPIEFVVGRVKKVDSLIKKAKEKGIDFQDENWQEQVAREVSDIAGLRVVCRYVDDVREVQQLLQEREDIVIHDIKDYIASPKDSGYRSIHMIASYTVYHGSEKITLFCEIQIRTLGMNSWATNEHELRYKYAGNIPADVLKQLQEASVITHQLDILMNSLRQEILTPAEVDPTLEDKLEEIFSLYVKQDLDAASVLYRKHVSGFEDAFADNPKFKMIYDLLGKRLG